MTDSATNPVTFAEGNGLSKVFTDSPLAKLNYFDGRYLRAADLRREQRYHEVRSELVAASQGAGVVYGLGIAAPEAAGAPITLTPGLGFNALGQPVLLKGAVTFDLAQLVAATAAMDVAASGGGAAAVAAFGDCAAPGGASTEATSATQPVHVVTIAPDEALCGREVVYGRLCEAACVQGSEANLAISGVILRARPLDLPLPPVAGSLDRHLRSRLAAGFFRREARSRGGLLAAGGLYLPAWCGVAEASAATEIALAVTLSRNGAWIVLDQWTVRRELMTPLPLGVWQGRMGMRRHEQFLAETLQFQCQLADALAGGGAAIPAQETPEICADLIARLALTEEQRAALDDIVRQMQDGEAAPRAPATQTGWLYGAGFVELSPAGFLPVDPASDVPLRRQVAAALGPLVDFRLIAAPADVIPHAFEEARDMRRVPLVADLLQNGEIRPQLEVYVPDATLSRSAAADDRATHAAMHAESWLWLALTLGSPLDVIEEFGLANRIAGPDASLATSLIHAGPQDGSGRMALISLLVRRKSAIDVTGRPLPALGQDPDLSELSSLVEATAEALLARGSDGSAVIGMTCETATSLPGALATDLHYVLALRAQDEVALRVDVQIRFRLDDDAGDIGRFAEGREVRGGSGKIEVRATYANLQTRETSSFLRILEGARVWIVTDPRTGETWAFLISELWDKSERQYAIDNRWPVAIALAMRRLGDSLVQQVLMVREGTAIPGEDLVMELIEAPASRNGASTPFDRSVAGPGFESLIAALAEVERPLADEVRRAFRVEAEGESRIAATRDWVMFRRSRAVVEAAGVASGAPARTPPPEPPAAPAEMPRGTVITVGVVQVTASLARELPPELRVADTNQLAEAVATGDILPRLRKRGGVVMSGVPFERAAEKVKSRNLNWFPDAAPEGSVVLLTLMSETASMTPRMSPTVKAAQTALRGQLSAAGLAVEVRSKPVIAGPDVLGPDGVTFVLVPRP